MTARSLLMLVLLAASPVPAAAQAACRLPAGNVSAERLVDGCAACLRAGRLADAARLWYAASIRLRTLAALDSRPDRTPALMAALQESLGRPVNTWLGGDVRDWRAAIDWAIAWDQRTDFADLPRALDALGLPVDRSQARATYAEQRAGIGALRTTLAGDPTEIYRTRTTQGLAVRDSGYDRATGRMRAAP